MKELEWNLSTLITGEEEFKTKISQCIRDREVGYSGSFNYAIVILDLIDLEDIATLP